MLNPTGIKKWFVPQKDPKELVRKWQSSLRSESRAIEKQIRDIKREQKKAEQSVREAAKRNDMSSARILAKELVQTKRVVSQLYANRAHIMATSVALSEQLAVVRTSGTLKRSNQIMEAMSKLLKIPEMMKISQDLAREMEKAGLIEEIVSETLDTTLGEEDVETEVEAEVEKIMVELTQDVVQLPAAKRPTAVPAQQETEEISSDLEEENLRNRLDAIGS